MSFLNPEQKLNDNNIDKDSDKIIAYLCNTSIWDGYANNLARYAVGAPSVEMWIDGYNAHLRYNSQYLTNGSVLGTEVWKEEFYRNTGDGYDGYEICLKKNNYSNYNSNSGSNSINLINVPPNAYRYVNDGQIWLASQCNRWSTGLWRVRFSSNYKYLEKSSISNEQGVITPVICMKDNVEILEK